jgi:hypothetical protein
MSTILEYVLHQIERLDVVKNIQSEEMTMMMKYAVVDDEDEMIGPYLDETLDIVLA